MYTYNYFESIDLLRIKAKIANVATHASMEEELLTQIVAIENFWNMQNINSVKLTEFQDEYIFANNEGLIILIDDTLLQLNSILSSRFV